MVIRGLGTHCDIYSLNGCLGAGSAKERVKNVKIFKTELRNQKNDGEKQTKYKWLDEVS